jgi:hypothetical protein
VNCDAPDSSAAPYCVVRSQVIKEMSYVSDIREFNKNILRFWDTSHTNNLYTLLQVGDEIQKELQAEDKKPAPSIVSYLIGPALQAGSYVPEVGIQIGVASTLFSFARNLANKSNGDSDVVDAGTTVGDLGMQTQRTFEAQYAGASTMFRFIYQDWGKVKALGSAFKGGGKWAWSEDTAFQVVQNMKAATKVSYYHSILPTLYAVAQIHNLPQISDLPGNAAGWYFGSEETTRGGCHEYRPMQFYAPEQYLSSQEIYTTDRWHVQPLGRINGNVRYGGCEKLVKEAPPYKTLDQNILRHLFGMDVSNGDLAVYKPDFYRKWEFPHVRCDPKGLSTDVITEAHSKGCDWAKAKLSTEELRSAVSAPPSTNSPRIDVEAVTSPETDGSLLSYSWEVFGGEATISNGDTATPSVEFTSGTGSYVVRVTVTSSDGRSSVGETTVVYEEP